MKIRQWRRRMFLPSSTASSIVGEGQVHAEGKGIRIQLRVLSGSGEKFYFILL